jgi:hypothetical protein|tara:strand:+ start:3015 stop:3314 length:300 start_codon:yes stop_codon:yes gene_type:complete
VAFKALAHATRDAREIKELVSVLFMSVREKGLLLFQTFVPNVALEDVESSVARHVRRTVGAAPVNVVVVLATGFRLGRLDATSAPRWRREEVGVPSWFG